MRRLFVAATCAPPSCSLAGGRGGRRPAPRRRRPRAAPVPHAAPAPDAGLPQGALRAARRPARRHRHGHRHPVRLDVTRASAAPTVEWDSWSDRETRPGTGTATTTAADGSYSMTALADQRTARSGRIRTTTPCSRRGDQTWTAGGSYNVHAVSGPGARLRHARRSVETTSSSLAVQPVRRRRRFTPGRGGDRTTSLVRHQRTIDGARRHLRRRQRQLLLGRGRRVLPARRRHVRRHVRRPRSPSTRPTRSACGSRRRTGTRASRGTTVRLTRDNFPAGWMQPRHRLHRRPRRTRLTRRTASRPRRAARIESVSVKVPATAKPGYGYWIGFQHVDAAGNELAAVRGGDVPGLHDEAVQDERSPRARRSA